MTRARRSVLVLAALALAPLGMVAGCSSLSPNPPDPHANDHDPAPDPATVDFDGGADGGSDASEDAP